MPQSDMWCQNGTLAIKCWCSIEHSALLARSIACMLAPWASSAIDTRKAVQSSSPIAQQDMTWSLNFHYMLLSIRTAAAPKVRRHWQCCIDRQAAIGPYRNSTESQAALPLLHWQTGSPNISSAMKRTRLGAGSLGTSWHPAPATVTKLAAPCIKRCRWRGVSPSGADSSCSSTAHSRSCASSGSKNGKGCHMLNRKQSMQPCYPTCPVPMCCAVPQQ